MDVQELAKEWLKLDQDPTTRTEIESLVNKSDVSSLEACLQPRIAFGTAGLRARVGAGFARMNGLVVIQTSQGLAQHLLDTHQTAATSGVVVGHDARHGSEYFAKLAAAAFIAKGLQVHWLGLSHTPLVPFTVKQLGAAGGVMVTASHNPKEDNGYKVYSGHSGQINQPEDGQIAAAILENLIPLSWDTNIEAKVNSVFDKLSSAYIECISLHTNLSGGTLPRFVYTPLHGVGYTFLAKAFEQTAKKSKQSSNGVMELVEAQLSPDPNFPTVKFPNPEEYGALDLAKEAADAHGISLIIANDPDADRFAAAEKVDGTWHIFKGDEIGVLLGQFLYEQGADKEVETTMLTSAVSSQMLGVIGQAHGFTVEETLTGFKWIGNRAREIGDKAVFGYEEALGYMIPDVVFDKDGIAAAMLFLMMCTRIGKTPYVRLQELYAEHGYFETMNTYWKSPSIGLTAATVKKIQEDPTMIKPLGADARRTRTRDLMAGTDSGTTDGRATLWSSPENQMITVWHSGSEVFRDGVRYTVRASGTEPKIKVYIECRSKRSAEEARSGAIAVFRAIGKHWFGNPELKVEERFQSLLYEE